jgi:hypothetical protein
MWFQRIEEVIDEVASKSDTAIRIRSAGVNVGSDHPWSRKGKWVEDSEEEDIRAFQRVRLLLKGQRRFQGVQNRATHTTASEIVQHQQPLPNTENLSAPINAAKPFNCKYPKCKSLGFSTLGGKQRHIRESHRLGKRCEYCDFTARRQYQMAQHVEAAHLEN